MDKRTTRLDWIYYAPTTDGRHAWGDGELPPHWQERRTGFDQIMDEDMMNMAPIQESMESPALRGIPINYQERRIWHLHEQLDRTIGTEHIPEHMRVRQLLSDYIEH